MPCGANKLVSLTISCCTNATGKLLKGKPQTTTTAHVETLSIEDKLKFAIINGEKAVGDGAHRKTLEELLEVALLQYSPLELINTVLLDGSRIGDGAIIAAGSVVRGIVEPYAICGGNPLEVLGRRSG